MSATCVAPQCDRAVQIKSVQMCSAHYQQQRDGRPFTIPRSGSLIRDEYGRKRCRTCREWLLEVNFGANGRSKDGLATYCLSCIRAKQRECQEYKRDRARLIRYGMTREQFDKMLASQGGRCAICRTAEPGTMHHWCIDHDHKCCPRRGESCGACIRGILCTACNKAIGLLKDDVEVLMSAAAYLQRMSIVRGVWWAFAKTLRPSRTKMAARRLLALLSSDANCASSSIATRSSSEAMTHTPTP